MNLHALVSPMISSVNPQRLVTVKKSTGYTTADNGTRVPTYDTTDNVPAQIQGTKAKELEFLAGNGVTGVLRSVHLNGDWQSIQRAADGGGDLLVFGGFDWLVVMVWETWPDWSRVTVQQQVPDPTA